MRLALALLLGGMPLFAQPLDPESFVRQLNALESSWDADPSGAANRLPANWEVNGASHTYTIPAAPLAKRLRAGDLDGARKWLAIVRRQSEGYASSVPRDARDARTSLSAILARAEFHEQAPPNALELAVERLRMQIGRWLDSLFRIAAQNPTASAVVFWVLIVGATLGLGWWLFSLWERTDRPPSTSEPGSEDAPVQSWEQWLGDARAAVNAQDYRAAIRAAYWAAMMRLQQDRAARIDFADTPRERLRRFAAASKTPLPEPQREPLSRITASLERFWYAKLPATPEDAERAFESMEALGCKRG